MLSQKYEGGFLCGLPEMYFEAALNWGGWGGDLTRRISSGLSSASKSLTILPSWSWIGWKGRIAGGWRSNGDYLKKGRYTTPMYLCTLKSTCRANEIRNEIARESVLGSVCRVNLCKQLGTVLFQCCKRNLGHYESLGHYDSIFGSRIKPTDYRLWVCLN